MSDAGAPPPEDPGNRQPPENDPYAGPPASGQPSPGEQYPPSPAELSDPGQQPYPGPSPYPGSPPYPGQPYPGPPYPGPPYPGPPYPGPPYPGQPYPGQPYPGPPYPGPPYPGQPYPGPPYPGQPYPGQPYPGPDASAEEQFRHGGNSSFWSQLPARFGDRALRRPEPRFTTALAGAGAAMAVFGLFVWMTKYVGDGIGSAFDANDESFSAPDTNRNYLAAVLFLLLVVLGYGLLIARRRGPLGTAGAVLSGIGIPLALGFLTFDLTSSTDGLPINLDLVYWLSVILWLASYLFVPGAQGRSFYIYLATTNLFAYALFKAAKSDLHLGVSGDSGVPDGSVSGFGTVAAIGIIFGLGYYGIAFLLDQRGKHGAATGLVYPAFLALVVGVGSLGPAANQVVAGLFAIVLGAAVCWYGGRFGRRFTCFAAIIGLVIGIFAVIAEISETALGVGILALVIGLVLVAAAFVAQNLLHEPDDLDPAVMVRSR
jgi:hypothetical protein